MINRCICRVLGHKWTWFALYVNGKLSCDFYELWCSRCHDSKTIPVNRRREP